MRRIPAALCALGCAAVLLAGFSLYPQSPVPPEGMNRTELETITKKYGLEQPWPVSIQRLLDHLFGGDWGCTWGQN